MRTLRIAVLAALLAVPLSAAPPSAPTAGTIPDELSRLNHTLEHIATLLERQVDGQNLDLLLRRVEIGSRRVTSLEQQLEKAESDKRNLEDQSYRLRSQVAAMKSQLDGMSADEQAANQNNYELGMKNMKDEVKLSDFRVQQATQRVLDLQNELDARKRDLQGLQDLLDRKLQGQ